MGRKGKEQVGSSSEPAEQQKRRRLRLQRDIEEEQQQEEELARVPKPAWASGSLIDQPVEWQAELFHDQMNRLAQRKEAFICEKEVKENEFRPFGITEKFRAVGWEAALKCYDRVGKNLFDTKIQEWVATL
ncbi:hypothetical protein HanXRQr2_Chr16g0767601 [Helianthus annuus]|uniref:Uncharacterized protein n=1 Tax=Helianthus annuus TaxID=4232 RepID=A0A9K3DUC4_HELAN|nr:hypothetical protein HanXRQr2_Chr16g0767601 [Helianthus annuus]KAJ0444555.1 hypothetical protein HanIR_Chr16g0833101 [Helianthus annuus]KAJ0461834.1 hypothetical protein HanHA89_Chr16g0676771 [Helianthus annuus]KAJ0642221.1 hypothetical protein HanLR1_Chr16g0635891 [Helianthus annuus]KAJ0646106.1 hypothetical protein HanOQP8_Chr16g0631461 [Helianthus annuus]